MKKVSRLLAGCLLLAVLVTSYIIIKENNQKKEENSEEKTALMDIDSDEITAICIEKEENQIQFEKSDENWTLKQDEKFPLDQTKVEEVSSDLTSLEANRRIDKPEDLSEYELDEPQEKVTITTKDGTETKIWIGLQNTFAGQYYIRISGKDQIYTVDLSSLSFLNQTLYDYASSDSFPVIAASEIRKVQVDQEDSTYLYVYGGEEESNSSWSVGTKEEDLQAGDESRISEINTAVNSLSYVDFVDYHCEEPGRYGLDASAASISIIYETTVTEDQNTSEEEADPQEEGEETKTEEHQLRLLVGNTDEQGNYYVMLEGSKEVYTMSKETLDTLLDAGVKELLDRTVSYVNMEKLGQLKVSYDQKEYLLEAKKEQSKTDQEEETEKSAMKYYVNQKEVESGMFSTFYSKLITAKGQTRDDSLQPEEGAVPELELQFIKDDGTSIEVFYYPYDTNFYLAVNGNKKLLVNKINVKEMESSLEELTKEE